MSWTDYFDPEKPNFTTPYKGIMALILAADERAAAVDGTPMTAPDVLDLINNSSSPVLSSFDTFLNSVYRKYAKPLNNPLDFEFDYIGYPGYWRFKTWQSVSEIYDYIGEDDIKFNQKLSPLLSAEWLRQKIKVLNLLTIAIEPSTDPDYPGAMSQEVETVGFFSYMNDNYTMEECVDAAVANAIAKGLDNHYSKWSPYPVTSRTMYQPGLWYQNHAAGASSSRERFYVSNTSQRSCRALVLGSPKQPEYNDSIHDTFDSGGLGFVEHEKLILWDKTINPGEAFYSDWIGDTATFPVYPPTPADTWRRTRGYNMAIQTAFDYAVPGGFEFY